MLLSPPYKFKQQSAGGGGAIQATSVGGLEESEQETD